MEYRTDLALENFNLDKAAHKEGVSFDQIKKDDVTVTTIEILNPIGEQRMGKPMGKYITIEVEGLIGSEDFFKADGIRENACKQLALQLKEIISFDYYLKVLVVGLGNDRVTPDCLGPATVRRVRATRHLFLIFECDGDEEMANVACICPGVTGETGLEAADMVKEAINIAKPDVVIVIDALAAKDIDRISTTIQVCDTGIQPGAGMGNHRKAINEETLGVKVIAIGVPTVIDARNLIIDAMDQGKWPAKEVDEFLKSKDLDMIVTSTDIDQVIKEFSEIVSKAINIVLHPGIYS